MTPRTAVFHDLVSGRMLGLGPMLARAGFRPVRELITADIERSFHPGLAGYMLAYALRDYLVTTAGIAVAEYEGWLADLYAAASDGSYCYAAMTFTYLVAREQD